MVRKNFFLAGISSLIIHSLFVHNLNYINNKKEKEIIVLDLSTYQEYSPPAKKIKTEEPKKTEKPKKIEKIKKIIKKEIIPIKKSENKIIKKKEIENIPEKKSVVKDKTSNSPKKTLTTKKNIKNATLVNEKLRSFLNLIIQEINLMASQSYPKQSVKRREHGRIASLVTLDGDGNLKNLTIITKKPKRLSKTTESIIKKYKFPKPPHIVLDSKGLIKIKIHTNFILK